VNMYEPARQLGEPSDGSYCLVTGKLLPRDRGVTASRQGSYCLVTGKLLPGAVNMLPPARLLGEPSDGSYCLVTGKLLPRDRGVTASRQGSYCLVIEELLQTVKICSREIYRNYC
jgi:hypothetical protein